MLTLPYLSQIYTYIVYVPLLVRHVLLLSIAYKLVDERRLMFWLNIYSPVSLLNTSIAHPLACDPGRNVQFILKYPVEVSSGMIASCISYVSNLSEILHNHEYHPT